MINHVESIIKSAENHPVSNFFSVKNITGIPEKIILELAFLPTALVWQNRAISMLGLLFDNAASLVGHSSPGDCMPVELEVFVHTDILPEQLKVVANIELVGHGHALL